MYQKTRLLLILFAFLFFAFHPAHASPAQCFAETGFCIDQPLFDYWNTHGGLAVFGFPISSQHTEAVESTTLTVQWFERDRLEIQPDGSITAGRLGARLLEYMHTPWSYGDGTAVAYPPSMAAIPPPLAPALLTENCTRFAVTGHASCGVFRTFWHAHGGLERFGYPISPIMQRQLEDGSWHWVQYYERRRLEYHPEYAGTEYQVLLGLLGTQLANPLLPPCTYGINPAFQTAYQLVAVDTYLGCPIPTDAGPTYDLPAAIQSFEHGTMVWINYPSATGAAVPAIYAVTDGTSATITHTFDTWQPGSPDTYATPPAGLFAPWRGFGIVLRDDPTLADQMGWAYTPEAQPIRADVQHFSSGYTMMHLSAPKRVLVFANQQSTVPVFTIDTPYP